MILNPSTLTDISLSPSLLHSLNLKEERTTILHCTYRADVVQGDLLRVWNCIVLKEENGTERRLLQAFNIALAPHWTLVDAAYYRFTLVFEGLSSDCVQFTLDENIPEPGGFFIPGICRNGSDVYQVEIREGIAY